MTVRDDISVFWSLSPRIVNIEAPSVEVTIEDLHDTLRELESRQTNLIYDEIVSTAGKEFLGGGVYVGLTSTLLNAKVSFEARKIWSAQGTVTTTDSNGIKLIDSSAQFITDGIEPGAWCVNLTDGSICSVRTVDSEYQVTTDTLGDGYSNTFTFGDAYRLINTIQCDISGGNLVALDGYGNSISPVLPTAGTQIVRTASSSATLTEQTVIQYASFNGGVTVDVTSPYSGTEYPVGTPQQPVNNLQDGMAILRSRGFTRFFVIGDLLINFGFDYSGIIFEGQSQTKTQFTISPAAGVESCEFITAYVVGELDGGNVIRSCVIGDLEYVDGIIEDSILGAGTITLSGVDPAIFVNCVAGKTTDTSYPIIDMGGSNSAGLVVRNFSGVIGIKNMDFPNGADINILGGKLYVDSTCVGGYLTLRGIGSAPDDDGGPLVVRDIAGFISKMGIADAVWDVSLTEYAQLNTTGGAQLYNAYHTQYGPAVTLSANLGTAGVVIGENGTSRNPSNNIADAIAIAEALGIESITISDGYFSLPKDLYAWSFFGSNPNISIINPDGYIACGSTFEKCGIFGQFGPVTKNGTLVFRECILVNCGSISGYLVDCGLVGEFSVAMPTSDPYGELFLVNCKTVYTDPIVVSLGEGPAQGVSGSGYEGAILVKDATTPFSRVGITFFNGSLILDSTCVSGTANASGEVDVTDNSGPGFTVDKSQTMQSILLRTQAYEFASEGNLAYANLLSLYDSRFGPIIHYDSVNGTSGAVLGQNGTSKNPINNATDLKSVADSLGIKSYYILDGSLTLLSSHDDWSFYGDGNKPILSNIDINNQSVVGSGLYNLNVTGTFNVGVDGFDVSCKDCIISDCSNITGELSGCKIGDNIIVGAGTSSGKLIATSCLTENVYDSPAKIYCGGSLKPRDVQIQGWTGALEILDIANASSIVDISSQGAHITLGNTCVSGAIRVSGIAKLTDNTGNGCSVDKSGLLDPVLFENIDFSGIDFSGLVGGGGGSGGQAVSIFANPGQTLLLALQTLDGYGTRADPSEIPQIDFVLSPSLVVATGFPKNMIKISTGLYYYNIVIPPGCAEVIGTYTVSTSWKHPTTGHTQHGLFLINVALPFGNSTVFPT
jgi:hypothetical protein